MELPPRSRRTEDANQVADFGFLHIDAANLEAVVHEDVGGLGVSVWVRIWRNRFWSFPVLFCERERPPIGRLPAKRSGYRRLGTTLSLSS
jgi:hypothetical protein